MSLLRRNCFPIYSGRPPNDTGAQRAGFVDSVTSKDLTACNVVATTGTFDVLDVGTLNVSGLMEDFVLQTANPKLTNSVARWTSDGLLTDSEVTVDDDGDLKAREVTFNNQITLATNGIVSVPYKLELPSSNNPPPGNVLGVSGITVSPPVVSTDWVAAPITAYPFTVTVRPGVDIPPTVYGTLTAAIAYVTTQSPSDIEPWVIWVYPGTYNESGLILPSYVSFQGINSETCIVEGIANNTHILTLNDYCAIHSMTIIGPTSPGFAAIYCELANYAVQFFQTSILYTSIGMLLRNNVPGNNVFAYLNDCAFADCDQYNLWMDSTVPGGGTVNYYGFSTSFYAANTSTTEPMVLVQGSQTIYNNIAEQAERDPPDPLGHGTFLQVTDSATVHLDSSAIFYFNTAVSVPNDGSSPVLTADGIVFYQCTKNIDILNSNTSGYYNGDTPYLETTYPLNGAWYISNMDPRIITVGQTLASNFQDVKSAVDVVASYIPSVTNRFIINIAPGEYTIPSTITLPQYVTLAGINQFQCILRATANVDVINALPNSAICNLTIRGPGVASTHSAVRLNGLAAAPTSTTLIEQVQFTNNWHSVHIRPTSVATPVIAGIKNCIWTDTAFAEWQIFVNVTGLVVLNISASNFIGNISPLDVNYQGFISTSGAIFGLPCLININDGTLRPILIPSALPPNTIGIGLNIQTGRVDIRSMSFTAFDTALAVPNSLQLPIIRSDGILMHNNAQDVSILNPNTQGNLQGVFSRALTTILATNMSVSYSDPNGVGVTLSGQLFQGSTNANTTNITSQIQQGSVLGLSIGGAVTVTLPFQVDIASGNGYVMTGVYPNDNLLFVSFSSQSTILAANSQVYIYIDSNGILQTNATAPNIVETIQIALVTADATSIVLVQNVPHQLNHLASGINTMLEIALGPVFSGGCTVTNSGLQLAVTQGTYFFGKMQYNPSAKALADNFTGYYQGGVFFGWNQVTTNAVPIQWDNAGILTAISLGAFIKHSFYVVGDGSFQSFLLVYAQEEFASLAAAETGNLSLPPIFFKENVVSIATVILDDTGTIVAIQDIKPTLSFRSGQVTSTANHSALINLTADDHKQYLLTDGTRNMAGSLNMGLNNVTNAGTYNSVTVEAHASRHAPGGADSLAIGAPVTISTANSTGLAASYSLSDHIHAHGNQPGDSLHSLATGVSNGFMSSAQFNILNNATSSAVPSTVALRNGTADCSFRQVGYADPTFSNIVTIGSQVGTVDWLLSLPTNTGVANQGLSTDGTGITSWSNFVSSVATGTGLTGGPITTTGTVSLTDTAVAPGPYTNANITVDQQGRIISASNGTSGTVTQINTGNGLTGGPITGSGTVSLISPVTVANGGTNSTTALSNNRLMVSSGGSIVETAALTNGQLFIGSTGAAPTAATMTAGTGISIGNGAGTITVTNTGVTNVATGTGLTGGPITTTGTVSLANTTVTAGSYTNANITVDSQGRLTAASTGASGGTLNPASTIFIYDDFFNSPSNGTFTTTNTFVGGDTMWWQTRTGGNSQASTTATNQFGVVTFTSGGGASNFICWSKPSTTVLTGLGIVSIEQRVRIVTGPTAAGDAIYFGLFSSTNPTTALPTGAVLARASTASANWQLITSTGAATTTSGTIAFAVGTWTTLRIDINAAASSVTLFVNGVASSTNVTNIPTTTLLPILAGLRGAAPGVVFDVDYWTYNCTLTVTR